MSALDIFDLDHGTTSTITTTLWNASPDPNGDVTVTQGSPKTVNSSGTAMHSFCADCGTGLFYRNTEMLPGIVDIQSATLDDPEALPPTVQIQTAERLGWMQHAHELPAFERFPG